MSDPLVITNGSYFKPQNKKHAFLSPNDLKSFEYYDNKNQLRKYQSNHYYVHKQVNERLVNALSKYSTSDSPEITAKEWDKLMVGMQVPVYYRDTIERLGKIYLADDSDGGNNITLDEIDLMFDDLVEAGWFTREK